VLSRQPWGGPAALATALAMTLALRGEYLWAAFNEGGVALVRESLPIVSLLALGGIYLLLARPGRSLDPAGVFATAVLFAWIHARVWPSPVPLLWLALGLGWLRWRSGSLVGPIVLHAVFNAIACVILLTTVLRG
jgi:membrane protease YdiL (CAAX protease family)